MVDHATGLRAFRPTFLVLGASYVLMASYALAKGTAFLEEFGVSHALATDPVVNDFYTFFYQLMAYIGVLIVVFGLITKGHRTQAQVASLFAVANILTALRDLSASNTRFGSAVYENDEILIFVAVSLVYALVFGAVAIMALRAARRDGPLQGS